MSSPSSRIRPAAAAAARPRPAAASSCPRRCGPARRSPRPSGTSRRPRAAPRCGRSPPDVDDLEHQVPSSRNRPRPPAPRVAPAPGRPPAPAGRPAPRDAALDEHLARVQHRHRVGERAHEVHVVLDDDDRALAASRCSSSPVSSAPRRSSRRPARRAAAASASCTSSMPISSHCFWPCGRMPARASARSAGRSSPAPRHLVGDPDRRRSSVEAPRLRPAAMSRFCSTRQLLEDRRRLERAARRPAGRSGAPSCRAAPRPPNGPSRWARPAR